MTTIQKQNGNTARVTLHYQDANPATVRGVVSLKVFGDFTQILTCTDRSLGSAGSGIRSSSRIVVRNDELRAVEYVESRSGVALETRIIHLHRNTVVKTQYSSKKNKVSNPTKKKPVAKKKPVEVE